MIRRLERSDFPQVFELMKLFAQETGIRDLQRETYSYETAYQVLLRCLKGGVSLVSQQDKGPITGCLLSILVPDLWIPEVIRLRELAWYVLPEHRGSSQGARLFFTYCEAAEELLRQGRIQAYTMTKLYSSDDFGYERHGLRLIEATYMKEL